MSSYQQNKLSAVDFTQTRPWMTIYPDRLRDPASYRDLEYRYELDDGEELPGPFQMEIDSTDASTGRFKPQNRMARLICGADGDADYLESMADDRYQIDDTPPNNDGRSLHHPTHIRMFNHIQMALHHVFAPSLIRFRHPISRIATGQPSRYLSYVTYRNLLTVMDRVTLLENDQDLIRLDATGALRDEFDWIPAFRDSVRDARESMVAAWAWSFTRSRRSMETASLKALDDIPEMTKLIIILLERERRFDMVLFQEHLFGCLYDKRIRLLEPDQLGDAQSFLVRSTRPLPPQGQDLMGPYLRSYRGVHSLYHRLSVWQHRLKKLFVYKYLIEWNWNKLWDRLYVVIHQDMHVSDMTIRRFTDWANNNGPVANNLFAVHPIVATELMGQVCGVCLEDLSENNHPVGTLVLKTKCGHYVHPKCIFTFWDGQNLFQNRCPMCRSSAGRLRDVIPNLGFGEYQEDHEYENTDHTQEMDDLWYDQCHDRVHHHRRLDGLAREVLEAYWLRRVEEDILEPQRRARAAAGVSWESALGGPA